MQYHYVDAEAEAEMDAGAARRGNATYSSGRQRPGACALTKWVGVGERYAWIDLSAGPVAYGAATSGEGVVTEHSMPRVARLRTMHAQEQSRAAQEMAVELAALVHASARHLLAPPLWWAPKRSYDVITVVLVRVAAPGFDGEAAPPLDPAPLRAQLARLALAGQRVEVEVVETSFDECRLCAAAYAAAIKANTATVRDLP